MWFGNRGAYYCRFLEAAQINEEFLFPGVVLWIQELWAAIYFFILFFFTKGRKSYGSNENSNKIYRPDLTHCSDAEEAVHSRLQEIEVEALVIAFPF